MGKVNKKPFRRDAEQTGKSKPVGKIDFQFFHSCCTKMLKITKCPEMGVSLIMSIATTIAATKTTASKYLPIP